VLFYFKQCTKNLLIGCRVNHYIFNKYIAKLKLRLYKSSLEILYKRKLIIDHLRVFGCTCYVHNNKRGKLDHTFIKTIFLRYSTQKKEYKCYDPINYKIYTSRDVTFQENESYFKEKEKKIEPPNTFIYPHHDYLRENEIIITNEGEHEFEETPQLQEEENKIQEGISENPQRQEEVGEGIEEISLRSST
jgi:hypothetical protein